VACPGQVPTESEEMRPQWWDFDQVPFDSMWADDPLWFPLLLAGKSFVGTIVFKDKTVIASHHIEEVSSADLQTLLR
jgi:hypothetical protein